MVNVDGDGKIHECGGKVNDKFTTNLKNHLGKHHTDILKELERKEKEKIETTIFDRMCWEKDV